MLAVSETILASYSCICFCKLLRFFLKAGRSWAVFCCNRLAISARLRLSYSYNRHKMLQSLVICDLNWPKKFFSPSLLFCNSSKTLLTSSQYILSLLSRNTRISPILESWLEDWKLCLRETLFACAASSRDGHSLGRKFLSCNQSAKIIKVYFR